MGQDIDESIVLAALVKIFTDIVNFIPNLVNGLIILLAGYLVARLVSSLIGFVSQIIYSWPARPILARGVIRVYNAL